MGEGGQSWWGEVSEGGCTSGRVAVRGALVGLGLSDAVLVGLGVVILGT